MTAKTKRILLIGAGAAVLIPVLLCAVLVILLNMDTQYYFFGDSRTRRMEELFGITVTEHETLLHFRDSSFLIAIDMELTLETDDYLQFLAGVTDTPQQIENPYARHTADRTDGTAVTTAAPRTAPSQDTALYYCWAGQHITAKIVPAKQEGHFRITLTYME